jgi:Tfp pilus assembly protein PilW
MLARLASNLRSERGFTLVELLVAMASGVIVGGALLAVIVIAQHQETIITDRTQADQIGRGSLERIQEELHSSCVGGSQIPMQKPEGILTGLETTNGKNLWFVSTYGVANSGEAVLKEGRLHDINWTETGVSKGVKVGRLTDYWFNNELNGFNYPPAEPWKFSSTLSTTTAEKHVLATNVIPPEEGTTVFHYYKYDTTAGDSTYGEPVIPLTSAELSSMSESVRRNIAKIKIEYQQAPETHSGSADTRYGHTTLVSGSVILRFTPSETTEEGTGSCS